MALGVPAYAAPAFPTAAHVRYGDVAAAWFTEPAGVLVQVQKPVRGTTELSSWLVGPAYDALDVHFAGRGGLIFVLDMSLMLGRSAAARSMLLNKARQVGSRFSRAVVIAPLVMPPLYLQSMRLTFVLLRTLGIAAEFADSSAAAVERLGLRISDTHSQQLGPSLL